MISFEKHLSAKALIYFECARLRALRYIVLHVHCALRILCLIYFVSSLLFSLTCLLFYISVFLTGSRPSHALHLAYSMYNLTISILLFLCFICLFYFHSLLVHILEGICM